jgi:aminoglycoside phosphotransferase
VNRIARVRIRGIALVVAAAALHGGPLLAAENPAGDIPVTADMTAVIALQGLPCGQVVSASQQGTDDYLATCQDGNRYRVYVNADGRVVVEKK